MGELGTKACRGAGFVTTLWSDVIAARDPDTPGGQDALAQLCGIYWYPLYAYARGTGASPEDAQDLTQGFFTRWVDSGWLSGADRERGRFRWFLLKSFQNYLRNELERARAGKRGGGLSHVSWDAMEGEQRYLAEPKDHASPDVMFDLRWGRAAMGRALDRLAGEFDRTNRGGVFHALKRYLSGHAVGDSYGEAARQLGLSPVAIKVTVHRLRQRYRDLVRDEVAQTLANPGDVDDELRHLLRLLAG